MEKPILFSTPMVQAILDDRKGQTRRVIKLPSWSTGDWNDFEVDDDKACIVCKETGCLAEIKCPYGKPGDILLVQETWKVVETYPAVHEMLISFKAGGQIKVQFIPIRYEKFYKFCNKPGWQSPYFMPIEACRLRLLNKEVKVERLQDITPEQCHKEGIEPSINPAYDTRQSYMEGFKTLWNSNIKQQDLNKYDWMANPWVWVIEFEKQ
jgi:hypothetical protein